MIPEPERQEQPPAQIPSEPLARKIWSFWVVVGFVSVIFFAIEIVLQLQGTTFKDSFFEVEWSAGGLLLVLQMLYIVASFKIVGPTRLGAVLLFGKPIYNVSSGLCFVPLFICTLEEEARLNIEREWPANPEKIYRGDGTSPEGFFPPNRITFGYPSKPDTNDPNDPRRDLGEDDPLNRRVTLEVPIFAVYRIDDFCKFLTTVGTTGEADRILNDIALGAIADDFGKFTPAVINKDLNRYTEKARRAVEEFADNNDFGISMATVQIKQLLPAHSLNEEIQKMSMAAAQKVATMTTAEGEKEKRRLEGEGDGLGEQARIDGRTAGYKRQATELGVPAMAVLGAETARVITENPGQKTVIVGTGGLAELIGVASGIAGSLKDGDRETPPEEKG